MIDKPTYVSDRRSRPARPKIHRAWDELETTALAGLDAADRETLSGLLDHVQRNLQRALDQHPAPCSDPPDDTR